MTKNLKEKNTDSSPEQTKSITLNRFSAFLTALATAVIAIATIIYTHTTQSMLSQMRQQTNQTQQTIDEMRASNKTMRDAYAEAIRSNQILQTQMEVQIEESFNEKLQFHYDLKKERDRIAESSKTSGTKPTGQRPEYLFIQEKLEANYDAMESLAKRYAPLGGKLAKLEKELPPKQDLIPPAPPPNVRVEMK